MNIIFFQVARGAAEIGLISAANDTLLMISKCRSVIAFIREPYHDFTSTTLCKNGDRVRFISHAHHRHVN
jgi:hypothetical protein